MTHLEKYQCMERLKNFLRKGRAGNPEEIAASLEVSPRTIKRWIANIRINEGWKIEYNRAVKKYVVTEI
ncbi:MAG: hypothetical protein KIPDCIKN_02861 [Haliscomenobacter sp.]|jgi:predicted DNA-binding transcriptional regulator YafY|nr:hypothetical protein [Haliscomenobacter sp.]